MATTITRFNCLSEYLADGVVDLEDGTIKLALVDAAYVFDATDTVWADISANEEPGVNGYTTGGATLASSAVTRTGGVATWDAADVTWTFTDSKTFMGAVLYLSGTVDSVVNPLIAYILFNDAGGGTAITINSVAFTVQWSASGIMTVS